MAELARAAALAVLLRMNDNKAHVVAAVDTDHGRARRLVPMHVSLASDIPIRAALSMAMDIMEAIRHAPADVPDRELEGLVNPRTGRPSVAIAMADPPRDACADLVVAATEAEVIAAAVDATSAQWLAQAMAERILVMLQHAVAHSQPRLDAVDYRSSADRVITERWHQPVVRDDVLSMTLPEHVARLAATDPDRVAVMTPAGDTTYAQLERAAARLAGLLRQRGVTLATRVGVCLDRTLELVVAYLAVMRLGGVVVPLDPAHPDARLGFIVADTGLTHVISHDTYAPRFAQPHVLVLDRMSDDPAHVRGEVPWAPVDPAASVAIVYTSGSTGQPKGVLVTQRGLCNSARSILEQAGGGPDERVLSNVPIGSVSSFFDLFLSLLMGARIVLPDPHVLRDTKAIVSAVQKYHASYALMAPWLLRALLDEPAIGGCTTLQRVLVGSEIIPDALRDHFHRVLSKATLCHAYGISEAACVVLSSTCRADGPGPVVLDQIVWNSYMVLLDESGRPVPVGVPGEIHVGGACLSDGYLHRELGEGRYHELMLADGTRRRLYATGDLAYFLPSGALRYLSRRDFQVQIRGFRVEPAEVEHVLLALDGVEQALVVARDSEGTPVQLVAYLVLSTPRSATELRTALAEQLPEHMIPSLLVSIPAIPSTPNNKPDRKALPPPTRQTLLRSAPWVTPRDALERTLAGLWAEAVDLAAEDIGVHDDFFALGGDSIRFLGLAQRAHSLGIPIAPTDVLRAPTIDMLARRVREHGAPPSRLPEATKSAEPTDELPLLEMQCQLHTWARRAGSTVERHNIPVAVRLVGSLDVERLRAAMQGVITRHAALRTCFVGVGRPAAEVRQRIVPAAAVDMHVDDCPAGGPAEALAGLLDMMSRAMDLSRAPLMRARLVRVEPEEHLLLMAINHMVFDGNCVALLVSELARAYDDIAWAASPVPGLDEIVRAELRARTTPAAQEARRAMRARIGEALPLLPDAHLGSEPTMLGRSMTLDQPVLRDGRLSVFQALLGCFQWALHRWSGHPRMVTIVAASGHRAPAWASVLGPLLTEHAIITSTGPIEEPVPSFITRARDAWLECVLADDELPLSNQCLDELEAEQGRRLLQGYFVLNRADPMPPLRSAGLAWELVPAHRYAEAHQIDFEETADISVLATEVAAGKYRLHLCGRSDLLGLAELERIEDGFCDALQVSLVSGQLFRHGPGHEQQPS
ncbi:non-ribosomal peptide synthetase [Paraliomyxa miuraensis]|uniref:non-ribosomal peptide synthetase n=1 Tax=Paraliomyxa miuraensis TaxID=376150 RepID=UPI00225393AA|nr:non-ribosomal peptide synthetase [Paraliomyxa miuraensis]MCX4245007.1 AMP-binding protein [Paraliomyxa miuraensis]